DDGVDDRVVRAAAADLDDLAAAAQRLATALGVALRNDREIAGFLRDEGVALGIGVILKRGVAVEVIFGDVEQDADARRDGRQALELEARHLEYGGVELETHGFCSRRTEVAANEHALLCGFEQSSEQRRGRAFAVGAADEELRSADVRARQPELADHGDA